MEHGHILLDIKVLFHLSFHNFLDHLKRTLHALRMFQHRAATAAYTLYRDELATMISKVHIVFVLLRGLGYLPSKCAFHSSPVIDAIPRDKGRASSLIDDLPVLRTDCYLHLIMYLIIFYAV